MTRPALDIIELFHSARTMPLSEMMNIGNVMGEDSPELIELMTDLMTQVEAALTTDEVKAQQASLYEEVYSQEELTELLSLFRSTPVLTKWVAITPELTKRSNLLGQAVSQAAMENILPEFEERVAATLTRKDDEALATLEAKVAAHAEALETATDGAVPGGGFED